MSLKILNICITRILGKSLCYHIFPIGSPDQALVLVFYSFLVEYYTFSEEDFSVGGKKGRHFNILFISYPTSEMTFISSLLPGNRHKLREFESVYNTQEHSRNQSKKISIMLSFMPFFCVCVSSLPSISYTITHTNKHSWPKTWLKSQIIVSILPLFLILTYLIAATCFISDKTQDRTLLPHYEHEDLFPLLGFLRERVFSFSIPSLQFYSFLYQHFSNRATQHALSSCFSKK